MPKKKRHSRGSQGERTTQPKGRDLSGGERGGDKEKPNTIYLDEPPIVDRGAS